MRYPDIDRIEDLIPLCIRIMSFKLRAHLRKVRRRGEDQVRSLDDVQIADAGPSPEERTEQDELLVRLRAAVARLEGRCLELMRLKLQGLDFAAIQIRLSAASINTVYTWDLRCRRRLRELMEQMP